jgi:ABC-type branched-subunit amino acid transport system ATPase component
VSEHIDDGLRAEDVVVRFGGLTALDGVSVHAPPGRITGLIGPNGAGKTTLFNVCSGLQAPAEGSVRLDGEDLGRHGPSRRARLGLGRTFQRLELFTTMTVRENVEFAVEARWLSWDPISQLGLRSAGRARRKEIRRSAEEVLRDTGLLPLADRVVGSLSTGQGRLVELARAIARQPRILLLDEPSSGLDPAESRDFGRLLRAVVASRGVGILMVEHDMSLVLDICDWIFVLDFGRPLMAGTAQDVRSSPEVQAAYLGKDAA